MTIQAIGTSRRPDLTRASGRREIDGSGVAASSQQQGDRFVGSQRVPDHGISSASVAANAWPAGMEPERAAVFARNELFIDAPPDRVFAWLTRAELWPTYYGNAHNVRITSETGPSLVAGARFQWRTFGIPLTTEVQVHEEGRALAWDARMPGLRAYHKWFLIPEGSGTRLVTEETDTGVVSHLAAGYIRRGLLREHQNWLEGLRRMAMSGDPPSA